MQVGALPVPLPRPSCAHVVSPPVTGGTNDPPTGSFYGGPLGRPFACRRVGRPDRALRPHRLARALGARTPTPAGRQVGHEEQPAAGLFGIRHSKAVAGPLLTVSRETWAGFIGSASSET
ncbi:DUF397 domain-containing protein [Streptomyces sp. SID4946]|nr:DUF397 domain-containing protein [Streptomyces sp. CRPSP2-6A1]MYQ91367.1 DUF397 domain-containing protein [Streptomyces sp. SID4946]